MSSTGVFAGFIRVNGVLATDRVSVFLSGIDAAISDANKAATFARKEIYLRPFSPEMFSRSSSGAEMKTGFSYTIKGNKIGAYMYGPLGHPGDGEYDHWPLREFSIEAKYIPSFLTVKILGVTESGKSGMDQGRDCSLSPLNFEIEFRVPSAEMLKFLQIPNGPDKYFKEKLATCG